jgi:hypothetical protein
MCVRGKRGEEREWKGGGRREGGGGDRDDAVMVITAHAPHIHGQRVVRVPEQDFGRTVAERHDSRGA